ncbi:hypothetical protein Tco_1057055 [Tanacetum coccineum]|uniref:Reverse transcriptase domain-containing protein n=1 Tax=Tanacetum coccineum TaxID=301880 RepID=A0ABQ5H499_9ASTR
MVGSVDHLFAGPRSEILSLLVQKSFMRQLRRVQIKQRIQAARDRQKSYADIRHKPLEFQEDDRVMLKVSPCRFGKQGKLNPRFLALGGNTHDLGSFGEETDEITDLHQILEEVLLTERGDGVTSIKRRRRDSSGDDVWTLATTSQRSKKLAFVCIAVDTSRETRVRRKDIIRVHVPRCMALLDYDEHADSLSTMDNEVRVTSPESTTQTLPSFEEY